MRRIEIDENEIPKSGDLIKIRTRKEVIDKYGEVYSYTMGNPWFGFPFLYVKEYPDESAGEYKRVWSKRGYTLDWNSFYFEYTAALEKKFEGKTFIISHNGGYYCQVKPTQNKGGTLPSSFKVPTEVIEIIDKGASDKKKKYRF